MENLKNEQSDLAKTAEFLRQTEQFLGKLRDENYATLSLNDLLAWQMSEEQRHEFSIYLSARVQFRLFSQMQRCFRDMSAMLRNDEELKHCFQIVTHAMLMSGAYFMTVTECCLICIWKFGSVRRVLCRRKCPQVWFMPTFCAG